MQSKLLAYTFLAFADAFALSPCFAESLDKLVQACTMCHGSDGNSPNAMIPSIAGITPEYFIHTMDAYKNGGRKSVKSEMMKNFVHHMDTDDIEKLAAFYSQQRFMSVKQEFDAQKAKQGEPLHRKYCEKCHENAGRITENNYGVLAGQWMPYLRQALKDYIEEKRRVNPMMITKLKLLEQEAGEDGIEQIIHYYGSK